MLPSLVDLVAALILLIGIFLWNSDVALTKDMLTFLLQVAQSEISEEHVALLLHPEPVIFQHFAGEDDALYGGKVRMGVAADREYLLCLCRDSPGLRCRGAACSGL
jgi:hypothetical protein